MSNHNVKMTTFEAESFSFALDRAQMHLVERIRTFERKRKVPNQVAHKNTLAFLRQKLDQLIELNDRIQRAARIRGY